MGYAPWILLAWWKIARAAGWRAAAPGAAMLVLANIFILNSGTAKESVMLIACLNAVGALAVFLMTPGKWLRWQRLAVGGVGLALFVLLSAPCWLLFLDALPRAFTLYDHPPTFQISPALLLGLFDELFYRQTAPLEMHSNPSANFLVLLGVLWTAAASRRMWKDRGCRTLVLGAAPAFLLAFGVVPPSLITRLPFLCNVSHVDNTFSCVLIVLSFPLAGLGLRDCFFPGNARQWRRDGRIALGLMLALACLYFGFQQAHPRIGPGLAEIPAFPEKSAFFAGYATALFAALAALLWARSAWRRGTTLGPLLNACVALAAIHFRHGIYPATKFDDYVVNLQDRIDLFAPSPAVQAIRRTQTEPGRVLGIGEVLPPGFNCALRLESPAHAEALISRYWRDFIEKSGVPVIWGWRVAVRAQELAALRPFLDFLNVRYYLGVPGEMPATPAGYQSLGMADLQVISSPGAWPRAFFTDSLARYRTTEEFVRLVAGGDGRPFAAVAENEPAAPRLRTAPAERQVVPATSYRLTSNSTEFTIEAPGPGVALLGETFEANCFRVSVNGQPAECFRANHLFKAIALPRAGRYVIRFTYEPAVWRIALAMSGAGTVLALIALIVSMSRRSATNLRNAQPGIPRRRERPELVAS